MSNSVYRLLERHQRLDDRLRNAQTRRFVDPIEIGRLKSAVDILLGFQNTDGGWATYEQQRGGSWLEV